MHYLRLNKNDFPFWDWPKVGNIQGSADAFEPPKSIFGNRDQGCSCAPVEKGSAATAMEVFHPIRVIALDLKFKHGFGHGRR
jgi:hypothetical protein